jgi:hypothetical protein
VRDFGYDADEPGLLSAEIGAYLAEGPAGAAKMGLSAGELAELYFAALVAKHGSAVYRFRSLQAILNHP